MYDDGFAVFVAILGGIGIALAVWFFVHYGNMDAASIAYCKSLGDYVPLEVPWSLDSVQCVQVVNR